MTTTAEQAANIIIETVTAVLRGMIEQGLDDPKLAYGACNRIASEYGLPLEVVIDLFETVLKTI